MSLAATSLARWLGASAAFHAVLCAAVWRVEVPVPEREARPMTLDVLTALTWRPAGVTPVPEPTLEPKGLPRPYLRPPPVALDAATLFPEPFPLDGAAIEALLAEPVLSGPSPPAAARTGADPLPLLRREPPAPLLE